MKKRSVFIGLFFLLCMLACTGDVKETEAAADYKVLYLEGDENAGKIGKANFSYVSEYNTEQGSYGYLYVTKGGKKTVLAEGQGLSSIILTNGTTVYYEITTGNTGNCTTKVYSISAAGKKKKKLFSVKSGDHFQLEGYYKGKIYYVKNLDPGTFCSYTLKSGKKKAVAKNVTTGEQYKQYFVLEPYSGDYSPRKIRIYNAKKGKTATLSKKVLNYNIISGSIYYVESKTSGFSGNAMYYNATVKKCRFDGSKKKTLAKNLKIMSGAELKKNSFTYYDINGMKKTKKF